MRRDSSRRMVQLNDGSWVSEESLAQLRSDALEYLAATQRGRRPMDLVGLDFETYGSVNLPAHGLDRYTSDPHFRPLIASVAWFENGRAVEVTFDFVADYELALRELEAMLRGESTYICAHNAGFEKAVLDRIGLHFETERFFDSAVVARAAGGGSRLEAAAPQLLGVEKMAEGKDLIKLFSIPGKYQEKRHTQAFCGDVVEEHQPEWATFKKYCEIDARLSLRLVRELLDQTTSNERHYQWLTMRMNQVGWPVDVASVEEMQRRYLENQEAALQQFREDCDAAELNVSSLPQLKAWCAERGVKATSFDEKAVVRLLTRIETKMEAMHPGDPKLDGYAEVRRLLLTKQILGGSSLKKLQVILDRVGADGRLRDQYLHCGAGQTLRTTGTGVQMQNLPRLSGELRVMDTLSDDDVDWTNDEMAHNLRQVFTSSHPQGRLIVGDFSSVESRGLAWLAGEEEKLEAFRQGLDVYKVGAAKQFGVGYDQVTKTQRTFGKVGELGCGYQAGGGAVRDFAAGMGVELTEEEAAQIVYDWRSANPKIVEFWDTLNLALLQVVQGRQPLVLIQLQHGFRLSLQRCDTPASLAAQHPGAQSVMLCVENPDLLLRPFLMRKFHGCYMRGRNVGYYKPSDRKTGDLWKNHYTDPKTKQLRFYELYGGKLAGILTQSFCRELFFLVLWQVQAWADRFGHTVVGQFHDEIVVDWTPGGRSLELTEAEMRRLMSDPGIVTGFPLAAEVKSAYRYIK